MKLVGDFFVGVFGVLGWAWDGERLLLGRIGARGPKHRRRLAS